MKRNLNILLTSSVKLLYSPLLQALNLQLVYFLSTYPSIVTISQQHHIPAVMAVSDGAWYKLTTLTVYQTHSTYQCEWDCSLHNWVPDDQCKI